MTRDSIVLIIKSLHDEENRCRLCMLYNINDCKSHRNIELTCCCNDFKVESGPFVFGFDNTKYKILQLSTGKCNLNTIMCHDEDCTSDIENCPKVDRDGSLEF